jgi:hypothetical protein
MMKKTDVPENRSPTDHEVLCRKGRYRVTAWEKTEKDLTPRDRKSKYWSAKRGKSRSLRIVGRVNNNVS